MQCVSNIRICHIILLLLVSITLNGCATPRATGDMGVVVERASGSVQLIETSGRSSIAQISGLGDLSHASIVYSRDERYAFVFGRDGGLTKIDILQGKIVKRIIQSGNSIGGAISQDGRLLAVSNYKPGGVKIFSSDTLELMADIPALDRKGKRSKVVGLVDAPGQKFVFSLYDADEIWVANLSKPTKPVIQKFRNIGRQPYDGLISDDGRHYIAGLFGEDGLAMLDMWNLNKGVKRILGGYGRGKKKLPVYKMPHLEGWAMAGNYAFLPAVGQHEVLVVNRHNWKPTKRIKVQGQPVFVMGRPDGRQIWVSFAFPRNNVVQVIDTQKMKIIKTIEPGKAVLHMEFTPRGEEIWISSRDDNRVSVFDTHSFKLKNILPMKNPSGIFFTARAHRIGL